MASTRCGISAKQLERELGVTYKTGVAHCYSDPEAPGRGRRALPDEGEVDGTWIGGKLGNNPKHRARRKRRGSGYSEHPQIEPSPHGDRTRDA